MTRPGIEPGTASSLVRCSHGGQIEILDESKTHLRHVSVSI
jgi:hypothetical protein